MKHTNQLELFSVSQSKQGISREQAKKIVSEALEQGVKYFKIIFLDGTVKKTRLTIYYDDIHEYAKGCRRYVYSLPIPYSKVKEIQPMSGKKYSDLLVADVLYHGRAFWQKRHINLWPEGEKWASLSDNEILALSMGFMNDIQGLKEYLYEQDFIMYGFPDWKKVIYLSSCHPADKRQKEEFKQKLIELKNALDNKQEFEYWWEGFYDYSVSIKLYSDGYLRGFLNAEYRGKGNGHYYILINEKMALFVEDD